MPGMVEVVATRARNCDITDVPKTMCPYLVTAQHWPASGQSCR
jgi:hypothetical protein